MTGTRDKVHRTRDTGNKTKDREVEVMLLLATQDVGKEDIPHSIKIISMRWSRMRQTKSFGFLVSDLHRQLKHAFDNKQ